MVFEINSFQDFEDLFQANFRMAASAGVHLLYRGHGKNSYENKPTICRYGLTDQEIIEYDRRIFEKLKASKDLNGFIGSVKLHPGFGTTGYLNDWLLLTQARHLEMPSRLQDWSFRREIGLFFAVSNTAYHNEPGHLWILPSPREFATSNDPKFDENLAKRYLHLTASEDSQKILNSIDPFNIEKTMLVHYPHSSPDWLLQIGEVRRAVQGGKFIVSEKSVLSYPLNTQFIGQLMDRIEIPASAKPGILDELIKRNIHEQTVLPPIPDDTRSILERIKSEALAEVKSAPSIP